MNRSEHTLCLIFRSKAPGYFSIERVFNLLSGYFARSTRVVSVEAPFARLLPLNIINNLLAVRKVKATIYHVTGDIHYAVLGLPARKTVLTIHDCVFMYRSKGFKKLVLQWFYLKLPVRHAHIVTTISEQSKLDIIRFTGCGPEKIRVIPNPLDEHIHFLDRPFNAAKPRILFLGSVPHKNLDRVIEALRGFPCVLDIVGRISEELRSALKASGITHEISTGLTDQELAVKYAHCDILLFPSTFEGFGLPIIESQKAGRVVITSDLSPMKEVAGTGAHLIDPYQVSIIRKAVELICRDHGYRQQLIQRGFQNCRQYEAEVIAARYLDLYELIVKQ